MDYTNVKLIFNVKLNGDAKLLRFDNPAGVPYSAIFQNGEEIFSCERSQEENMIKQWNSEER